MIYFDYLLNDKTKMPLMTKDIDIVVPERLDVKANRSLDKLLMDAGFHTKFKSMRDVPSVSYEGIIGDFEVEIEFLTQMKGEGKEHVVIVQDGLHAQAIRYIVILLENTFEVAIDDFEMDDGSKLRIRVPSPALLGFKGGTACYLFYKLPRFSVDLDFSLLDTDKKDVAFRKLKRILQDYGDLKEARSKRFTLFFLLSYGEKTTNIKVEVSLRTFPDQYEILNYLGISMLVMTKEHIMAHKLVAFLDRRQIANRDLYDLWFFFKNNWKADEKIVELRTEKKFSDYLRMCIEEVKKVNNTYILQGLGEVLDDKQKHWVKTNLKDELIFLMQNYLV